MTKGRPPAVSDEEHEQRTKVLADRLASLKAHCGVIAGLGMTLMLSWYKAGCPILAVVCIPIVMLALVPLSLGYLGAERRRAGTKQMDIALYEGRVETVERLRNAGIVYWLAAVALRLVDLLVVLRNEASP